MKVLLCFCICGLALAFCSAACSAQCSEGWTTESFHCDGPGCSQGVTVAYPMSADQYGVAIVPNPQDCCGQLFSSFMAGGNCNPEMLKKPGVKRQIARLAATSDMLVADCEGRYVAYDPTADSVPVGQFLALADEHVLR